jgi:hypothetical protein
MFFSPSHALDGSARLDSRHLRTAGTVLAKSVPPSLDLYIHWQKRAQVSVISRRPRHASACLAFWPNIRRQPSAEGVCTVLLDKYHWTHPHRFLCVTRYCLRPYRGLPQLLWRGFVLFVSVSAWRPPGLHEGCRGRFAKSWSFTLQAPSGGYSELLSHRHRAAEALSL